MTKYLDFNTPAIKQAAELASSYKLKNHGSMQLNRVYWNRFGVGKRINIRHTRNLLNAALDGKLTKDEYWKKYDALAARFIENFK